MDEIELSSSLTRPVDLSTICRLCLSHKSDSLKSVFDEALGPTRLPQKIQLLIQIQISKNDKLSTMVCNDCIIRLDTWFAYKRECHRNQQKLAEWLNISKSSESAMNISIKSEPVDPYGQYGLMPVKEEVTTNDEEYGNISINVLNTSFNEEEHPVLESLEDISTVETDDDRTCPDCGKMFGNAQNRRRHQNMMHTKKERRAQMMEIRRSIDSNNRNNQPSETTNVIKQEHADSRTESMELETSATESDKTTKDNGDKDSTTKEPDQDDQKISSSEVIEPDVTPDEKDNIDSNDVNQSDNPNNEKEQQEKTSEKPESSESLQNDEESEVKPKENAEDENPEVKPPTETDEKKIQFAAGLRLVQKDQANTIDQESLSKIEHSYVEKCKAMVSMFHTLQCACHNVQHKTLRYLLSHLRETRIWFPLFTCYNCMISLTDRSTFTRHYSRCPKPKLETLIKLSNVRKRSELKTRLYQNFKCNRCKFLFTFHDDFCKHIDEDHAYGSPPFYCSCRYVFDTLEEYKTHCYTSCVLSYYCDICFITTSTLEEFVKHAQETHDSSEGFVLLQENTYIPRANVFRHKETDESNVVEGKRERRKSSKEPIMVHVYDREIPPDLKDIPTKVIKKMIPMAAVPTTANGWNKTPAQCPLCKKNYSSVNNMVRHYRTHVERREVEIPREDLLEGGPEDLITCPDCGGVYPASKWSEHVKEMHSSLKCGECDKEFKRKSDLDQHRSVHLNLKLFRDSKTQAYRSEIVSPTAEANGLMEGVMLMCEICDDVFNSKEELSSHKMVEHNIGSTSNSIMENAESEGDNEPLFDVGMEDESYEHEVVNEPIVEQPFCGPCNKPFASEKSLKEHTLNKHGAQFSKKNEYPKQCHYCEKKCTTGAGFRIHMQMHERQNNSAAQQGEYPKKCEYCDKICNSGAGYYLHTQMHERVTLGDIKIKKEKIDPDDVPEPDSESYHTCKKCFKVFGTKGKLKEHMKCHGSTVKATSLKKTRKVLCDLCHVALESREALALHKQEEHGEEIPEMLHFMNEIDMHQDSSSTGNSDAPAFIYACDVCEETFSSKPELKTHKEYHNKSKLKHSTLTCKHCRISFDSINALTKHMHREHGESAKPKITKESAKTHKSKDSSDKPYKCPTCNKGFATHGAMTTHSGWHKRGNNQTFANTPRGTAAAKKAKKQKLLKKIENAVVIKKEEPREIPEFQCATCFAELPNETALQIHILEQHGNLDVDMLIPRCNICNKDFSTQEEYETHKRFHDFLERQKKHEQQMKSQQPVSNPIIQNIQSVSVGGASPGSPKKFPCNWCNSIFSRQDTLNTHIKQHHKEHAKTQFECHECFRVFDKQNSLTIHLKMHQKQKSMSMPSQPPSRGSSGSSTGKVYVCSLCNMRFNYPKDLRSHTITAHPF